MVPGRTLYVLTPVGNTTFKGLAKGFALGLPPRCMPLIYFLFPHLIGAIAYVPVMFIGLGSRRVFRPCTPALLYFRISTAGMCAGRVIVFTVSILGQILCCLSESHLNAVSVVSRLGCWLSERRVL